MLLGSGLLAQTPDKETLESVRSLPGNTLRQEELQEENEEEPTGFLRRKIRRPPLTLRTRRQTPLPTISPGMVDPLASGIDGSTYRLAAGDVLSLALEYPGHSDSQVLTISASGTLHIYPLGTVKVAGMPLDKAQRHLRTLYSNYYRDFSSNLQLLRVRRFPVQVGGEVVLPGEYEGSGMTTVAQLLIEARGLTPTASLRRIRLIDARTGHQIRQLDLLRWMHDGKSDENPYVSAQQVVNVPTIDEEVELTGELNKPGRYEILPGETVASLVNLVGGFTAQAQSSSVQLVRLRPDGTSEARSLNLSVADSPDWNTPLKTGDLLRVFDATLAQGRVLVIGELIGDRFFPKTVNAVTGQEEYIRKGVFKIARGQTVSTLLRALGGPTAKADLEHAFIERTGPHGEMQRISVNIRKLLSEEDSSGDIALQDGDMFAIPAIPDNVYVTGHVFKPGVFAYEPGLTLRDYLALAGGTTAQAHTKHGRLIRPIPGQPPVVFEFNVLSVVEDGEEPRIKMRAGDIIYVPLYQPIYTEILQVVTSSALLYNFLR